MELFYNKNILNRDIERKLTTKEVQDYFNEGLLYIIYKDYYEITNDEIKQIEIILNNKVSIKEIEKEILKLILKNRNSNCFKFYFDEFGFTDEFDIEKNRKIIDYIFWNLNIKGLKKIIEIGLLKKYSLSTVGEINLSNDWSEFLELFLSQKKVVVPPPSLSSSDNNIGKWFKDIFSKNIIKAKLENDYTDLNKFQKIISNTDSLSINYKRDIISNHHSLQLIDNFEIFKWFYQLFLQFEFNKPPNHFLFIINSIDQVDFLVEKVYKEYDDINFKINFENYQLVNYFIEKGNQVGKDFTQFQTDLFSSLFDRSLEKCDIETLKIISSLGLKFRSDSLLKFNEPLSKNQIIELINFLNSIEYKCFKKPISYSFFYNLINLCKNNDLNGSDVKINFNCIPNDSLTIFITALTYSDTVLEFILNSKFTLYLNNFEKQLKQNPIRNHSYYKGIIDHHILYENNIKILIKKFKSNELILISNVINSLYLNLLFSTQLNHNKSMSEIQGNNYLKENINNLEKLFILNAIEINVTLPHVKRWLMLKSKCFSAYFQKFDSFFENKELCNEMVIHFSFNTILNSETSELFSKIRKLFFKYKSKNFKDNLEFLLHYKYYDLVIEQIIQYETNPKRSSSSSSFLVTMFIIMPSSLPIEEFQKIPLETICKNIPFSELISKLIDLSIKFDRIDIFKYLLSSFDNQNLLFDHFPILDKSKIQFLEFFLIYKNDLFVKHMETHLPYNFSKLKENEICVNLLSKYLPSHYQMKEFFNK
ncbi:hypothetical protein ACTFIZ_007271 [Dictyostelium cf. discoideum]